MTLPASTTKSQAYAFDEMIRALYAIGAYDLLDALVGGEYPLADARRRFDPANPGALVTEFEAYRRRTQADRIDSEEVLDDWLESLGESPNGRTKVKYRGNVERYLEWIRQGEGVTAVSPEHFAPGFLRRYQTHLLGECAGWIRVKADRRKPDDYYKRAATCNRHFIGLSSFGGYLKEKGIIEENWARARWVKRLKERKNKDAAMSREVWRAFRAHAKAVDKENAHLHEYHPYPGLLLWDCLVATGTLLRQECLENLTPRKIQRNGVKDRGMIPVAVDGTKASHRDRKVYVPKSLVDRMDEHCERYGIGSNEFVFARPPYGSGTGKREPFSDHLVLKVWNQVMERLVQNEEFKDCGHYRPGHLRHTFGRFAIEGHRDAGVAGVDIITLARLMGHGSITTTQRYLEYSSDSADAFGAWVAGLSAGLDVEGSLGSPEKDAAARIVEAARKVGLDPTAYFRVLLQDLEA